jgi:hypothetical protein
VAASRNVVVGEAPLSSKDYILVDDAVRLLEAISLRGRHRTYNVASGHNVNHQEIAGRLTDLSGVSVGFLPGASLRCFPRIDVSRIVDEFGYRSGSVLNDLRMLVDGARAKNALE